MAGKFGAIGAGFFTREQDDDAGSPARAEQGEHFAGRQVGLHFDRRQAQAGRALKEVMPGDPELAGGAGSEAQEDDLALDDGALIPEIQGRQDQQAHGRSPAQAGMGRESTSRSGEQEGTQIEIARRLVSGGATEAKDGPGGECGEDKSDEEPAAGGQEDENSGQRGSAGDENPGFRRRVA